MADATNLDLAQIAELVIRVDRLARDVPEALVDLRSVEAEALVCKLPVLAEALRLAISLELPPTQLAADASKLHTCFRRLQQLATGSRIPGTSKAALEIGVALSAQLVSQLGP